MKSIMDQTLMMVGLCWGWLGECWNLLKGTFFCITELMKNSENLICEGVICWKSGLLSYMMSTASLSNINLCTGGVPLPTNFSIEFFLSLLSILAYSSFLLLFDSILCCNSAYSKCCDFSAYDGC